MLNLLASVVELTEPEGKHIIVNPTGPMVMSALYLFLLILPIIFILLFFFYKKKLQNQQILAAIEKGLPVTDLLETSKKRETGWIANISAGIGFLFVATALAVVYYVGGFYKADKDLAMILLVISIIFAGIGLTRLLRGLFQKANSKNTPTKNNNTVDAKVDN